jgi:3-oxoacyl-[acyl-carrier protein] reductase
VPGAIAVAGDVRDAAALTAAVDRTVGERGRLDIIVNNAGGPPPGTFESTPEEAWPEAFELSLHSAIRLARLALPHLRRSGRGRIINITSWSVREPIPNLMLSNAIRPGVVGWAKTLSHELGPVGITVNSIAPGKIDTPRVREVWQHTPDPDAARERDVAAIPARRLGSPDEIGAAVAFLCSRQAGYISGAVLPVDGGALRGIW